ncbi:MAG: YceI family protein [Candidatus Zixiibacteriota bacterium]
MNSLRLLEASFLLGLLAVTGARAERFIVDDVYGRNLVEFTSRATLETIVGMTNQVGGYIEVDPDDILTSPDCYMEVDLRSLKTGIEARDRKMREEFLEVDSFPKATFKLEGITKTGSRRLVDQREFELVASGVFFLHGIERPIEVSLQLTYVRESEVTRARQPGDLLHLVARFEILLSDFGIGIPHTALLKLDERQSITVDVFAFTASEN